MAVNSVDENSNISVSHITSEHLITPFSVTLVLIMILMHFKVDKYFVSLRFHLLLQDVFPLLRGSTILTFYIYYRNPHLRKFVKNMLYAAVAAPKSNEIAPEIMA